MTRHSRNCTANAVYSYHEKQKDAQASGFGSLKARFSKDAVKDFDCCCLTLHPCKDPVLTKEGYLYDKEALLEYIVAKKNEIRRKTKEYEKQCKKEKTELQELGEAEQRSKLEKFLKTESSVSASSASCIGGASTSGEAKKPGIDSNSISNMSSGKAKVLPSFWIPALTPANSTLKLHRPDKTVYCSMSGKPLRLQDLIPVKFTLSEDPGDKRSIEGKSNRYKCPVTGDVLGNNVPCAVLKPTGHVVTMECVNLIKKDMIHPLTGQKLEDSDIIPLQRGGTGFARVNDKLVAKKARPVMQT